MVIAAAVIEAVEEEQLWSGVVGKGLYPAAKKPCRMAIRRETPDRLPSVANGSLPVSNAYNVTPAE
jgi:hypothetical protein